MKRSSRRNFARLLALESLESRRLLTTAMPDSFSLLEDSPTALLDVMANDIVTRNVATILMSIVRKLRQRRDSQWRQNYGYSRSQAFGEALFTYTIRDQFGTESTGTAAITISAVNDAPTINQVDDIRTSYSELDARYFFETRQQGQAK